MAFKLISNKHTDEEVPEQVQEVEVAAPKKEKVKQVYEVVAKLPVQEIRRYKREDGAIVNLITIEEYLTGQANAGTE